MLLLACDGECCSLMFYNTYHTSLSFWLGRLAFVSDGVSINGRFEAERPPASVGPPWGGRAATFVPYV